MWNSLSDKIIVTSHTWWFWAKATCHKLDRRRADFFQDYPNEIRLNLVHLCPSMLLFPFAVFLLSSSTVLSSYCNVSFYFLDILGVMNVHHSEADGMFKLGKHGAKTLEPKPTILIYSRIFPPTASALIGYFEVTWYLTIKLFPQDYPPTLTDYRRCC